MKRSKGWRRVRVNADGRGVVSHAGAGLLREMAEFTGLVGGVTDASLDTYKRLPVHPPGRVFTDLAVAVADGADAISGIAVLADRIELFGPVASMPTTWRVLDRIDAAHLPLLRAARARAKAWAAGAEADLSAELRLDFDAPITIAHSEKQNAAATRNRTFGFHPLLCFLDRPEVASGEALAGVLRAGNAGSNTAGDHIGGLEMALAALPEAARPRPGDPSGPRLLARSDSAGATHAFAVACRDRGVGFSFRFPVDHRIQRIVNAIPDCCWHPALEPGDDLREGAWVAEATGMIDLKAWPGGSRLILRKERPHPGAQLSFTDVDGHRIDGDTTDVEVYGRSKQDSAHTYTGALNLRPHLCFWAEAGVPLAGELMGGTDDPRASAVAMLERAIAALPVFPSTGGCPRSGWSTPNSPWWTTSPGPGRKMRESSVSPGRRDQAVLGGLGHPRGLRAGDARGPDRRGGGPERGGGLGQAPVALEDPGADRGVDRPVHHASWVPGPHPPGPDRPAHRGDREENRPDRHAAGALSPVPGPHMPRRCQPPAGFGQTGTAPSSSSTHRP